MKRSIFKCSLVAYIALAPLIVFSLSVPPGNLPVFALMAAAAAAAVVTREGQPRVWRTLAIAGLALAILGGILELLAGHRPA